MNSATPTMREEAQGGTRWRRFGLAFTPPMIVLSVIVGLLATGAIALPVQISGVKFKVEADRLEARGFRQYGTVTPVKGGNPMAVAVSELDHARLTNLKQTVCVSTGLPGPLGHAQMVVRADAEADRMVVAATDLKGNVTFDKFQIGGATPDSVPIDQTATRVVIENLDQTTVFTSADVFKLTGLSLGVNFVGSCPNL